MRSVLQRDPRKRQVIVLCCDLWDGSVQHDRESNHRHLAKTLSDAGRRGAWRRWHREKTMLAMLPMVERVARDVRWMFAPHLDLNDLKQAGCVGLAKAANAFHPARASSAGFEPFAYFRVRGAIIDSQKRRVYREEQHESLDRRTRDGVHETTLLDSTADTLPIADELAQREEIHRLLHEAIADLPDVSAFVLRGQLAGQALATTAAQMGRSVTWTRAKLSEARAAVTVAMRAA